MDWGCYGRRVLNGTLDPRLKVVGKGHPGLPLSRDVYIKRRIQEC